MLKKLLGLLRGAGIQESEIRVLHKGEMGVMDAELLLGEASRHCESGRYEEAIATTDRVLRCYPRHFGG